MDEETASLDNATRVCDMIVTKRIAQLQDCEENLVEVMRTAAAMHAHCIRHNYYFGAEGANGSDVRHFKAHLKTVSCISRTAQTDGFTQLTVRHSTDLRHQAKGCRGSRRPPSHRRFGRL